MAWGYDFKSDEKIIDFYPQEVITSLTPPQGSALIAIESESYDNALDENKWEHCLKISFSDTEDADDQGAFRKSHAIKIIKFVRSLPEETTFVAVSWLMGKSRSAAVVKFLAKYIFDGCYNQKFDKEYKIANQLVYKVLENVRK